MTNASTTNIHISESEDNNEAGDEKEPTSPRKHTGHLPNATLDPGQMTEPMNPDENAEGLSLPQKTGGVKSQVNSKKRAKLSFVPIKVQTDHPRVCNLCYEAFEYPSELKRHKSSKVCIGMPCKVDHIHSEMVNLAFSTKKESDVFMKTNCDDHKYLYHSESDDFKCRYTAAKKCTAKFRTRVGKRMNLQNELIKTYNVLGCGIHRSVFCVFDFPQHVF